MLCILLLNYEKFGTIIHNIVYALIQIVTQFKLYVRFKFPVKIMKNTSNKFYVKKNEY